MTSREYDSEILTKYSTLPNISVGRQTLPSNSENYGREAVSDSPQTTERGRYEAVTYAIQTITSGCTRHVRFV